MEEQGKLDIQAEKKMNTVEEYQFEPIKGYPMLHWKGKRPFSSTQFYPAQLKESYGEPVNDWMNKIFWGDNLQVMSHLLKEFRGKIDLVCIDPPFDSKADYKRTIELRGKQVASNQNSFEEKQYTDIWNNDEYLQFMYERLILIKELLSSKGIVLVHCDWHKSHHLRCIMDEIFGNDNFINEVVWQKIRTTKSQSLGFGNIHDNLLIYKKSGEAKFNPQYVDFNPNYIKSHYKIDQESGRLFRTVSMLQKGSGPARNFGGKILEPPKDMHWIWSQERIDSAMKENRIRFTSNGRPEKIQFLDEMKGDVVADIWSDIYPINSQANEKLDYPTQKPESLLERIIKSFSNPGDIIFDCFMGSGTTQAVSMKLGRKFIGADINLGAIETTVKRLNTLANKILTKPPIFEFEDENEGIKKIEIFYVGFSIFNVNNYDVFRNPIQAKELLKEALEIQPLPNNTIYDGEKDGRMVKIMPVNRIATRADLNELISGFNIKSFEKKFETSPNKSVESILLVCMGHEADLGASLQKEMHPYKLDVEVVDILRDKSNLEFKRESEAEIVIEKGKLIIKQFYPMNLLQKLSIMKENVEDWKELTESVKVDFNYDGAVFEPKIVDVPEKDEMVKGEYLIPEDAGTIRIKITDLLSESFELTIENK
jgi:DNA modification methylase